MKSFRLKCPLANEIIISTYFSKWYLNDSMRITDNNKWFLSGDDTILSSWSSMKNIRTQSSKRYVRLSVRIPYLLDKYFHNVTKISNFIQFLKKKFDDFFQSESSLRCFRTSKYHQNWSIFREKYRNYFCICQSEKLL